MPEVPNAKLYRDGAGHLFDRPDDAALDALSARVDSGIASMPKPASSAPMPEKTGGATGSEPTRYALEDHQHPRLTSTTQAVLATDGTATVTFTRAFVNPPGVNITELNAAGKQPLVCTVQGWVQDGEGRYTGCLIRGQRARMLPTINPLSGTIALLGALITGINGFLALLTNYNVFGGEVAGAQVSVIAVARSDVSAA